MRTGVADKVGVSDDEMTFDGLFDASLESVPRVRLLLPSSVRERLLLTVREKDAVDDPRLEGLLLVERVGVLVCSQRAPV